MSRIGSYSAIGYPVDGGSQAVSFTAASARTAAGVGAQDSRVVLTATEDCHIVFGGSTVAATTSDFFLKSGTPVMFTIRGGQYVAAIRASTDGTLHVSRIDA